MPQMRHADGILRWETRHDPERPRGRGVEDHFGSQPHARKSHMALRQPWNGALLVSAYERTKRQYSPPLRPQPRLKILASAFSAQ